MTGKQARSDFWWLFSLLSGLTSTLAIVALARHAFAMGSLSAPMALIMDAYDSTMQTLFGWAQPYLQAALTELGRKIGWQPTLYPQWRDLFVILGLVVAANHRAARQGPRPPDGLFSFSIGLWCIVFLLSILGSTVPPRGSFFGLFMIMFGAGLFSAADGWWRGSAKDLTFGLTMLAGLIGALAFFAIDAGLKLLGA